MHPCVEMPQERKVGVGVILYREVGLLERYLRSSERNLSMFSIISEISENLKGERLLCRKTTNITLCRSSFN